MVAYHQDMVKAAKAIVEHVGKHIIIAVPLGLGKPIGLLNALYRLASQDTSLDLTIITGLTLARPLLHNELEKRLLQPILQRMLKDYEDPLYEIARLQQALPDNIHVYEFFLAPGLYLHNAYVQQHYVSSAYTNAVRDALIQPINVHAQMVASNDSQAFSLSCNSDLFYEMSSHLKAEEKTGKKVAIVAEVNNNLPYMYGKAIIDKDYFSDVIDTGQYKSLFALPREAITPADHMIGIYTSTLIQDDGCLQIGIGKLSNAVANAVIFRQQQPHLYSQLLADMHLHEHFPDAKNIGSTQPFAQGLYASTEMLSDEYLQLYNAGILKKKVYDDIGLQRLLNDKLISDIITPDTLDVLLKHQLIHAQLTLDDVTFLQTFGLFKADIRYQQQQLILANGEQIAADLSIPSCKTKIMQTCLGERLASGKIIHAGFFIGSVDFYKQLHNMSEIDLKQIDMTTIARTNELLWNPTLLMLQRKQARFINSAIIVNLNGGIISDGLKDYHELSGVGGQFDFANMANKLADARFIINCRSTRQAKEGLSSNIIWDYPNLTLPRFLRDIIVTEYGIAVCRGKPDAEIIQSILNITDSRFQADLLLKAKQAGKIPKQYEIPAQFKNNYPHVINKMIQSLQDQGYFATYPFGSDLTQEEQVLANALMPLKNSPTWKVMLIIIAALFYVKSDKYYVNYLNRMQLLHPKNIKEYLYKKIVKYLLPAK